MNITNLSTQVKNLTNENKALKESLAKLKSDNEEKSEKFVSKNVEIDGNLDNLNDAIVDLERRFKENTLGNDAKIQELNTNVDKKNDDLKGQLTEINNTIQEQGITIKTVKQRVVDGKYNEFGIRN